ncbi:MAG: hypothetical protein GXP31_12310 [Kiritimatiellaeota bacterium]|nr:hypothetical protein [Kiritimatiellota bacterium]
MKRPPDKHLSYFTVLEALREATACPFCHIEKTGVDRYLSGVLDEHVNDPGVRRDLARARGYCPRHAHRLLRFGGALGTAILYGDQVRNLREELQALATGRAAETAVRRTAARWTLHEDCPACRHQAEERKRAVSVLLEFLAESELRTAFKAAPLPCLPHFFVLTENAGTSTLRRFLVREQLRKLDELAYDLEEFCRKQDYRFRHEPMTRERDAWLRAAAVMTGEAGVF